MKKITWIVKGKTKYAILITLVVSLTAFFTCMNIFNSFASGSTDVSLTIDPNGGTYEGESSKVLTVHNHVGNETEGGDCYSPVYHVHTEACNIPHEHSDSCYEACTNRSFLIKNQTSNYEQSRPCTIECTVCHYQGTRTISKSYEVGRVLNNLNVPHNNPNPICGLEGTSDLACLYKNYQSGQVDPGNIDGHALNCIQDDFVVLNPPTRDGYTFNGWTSNSGINTYNEGGVTKWKGNSNTTLTANWTPNTYTVEVLFVKNGGTLATTSLSDTVTYPDTVAHFEMPEDPTKEGYTFSGWFDSASGGRQLTSLDIGENNYPGNQTVRVYAQWTRTTIPTTEVELVIDANGGTYEGEESKTYNVHNHNGNVAEGGECYSPVYHTHVSGCYISQAYNDTFYCTGPLYWNNYDAGIAGCYGCNSIMPGWSTSDGNPAYNDPHNSWVTVTRYRDVLNCAYKDYETGEEDAGNIVGYSFTCDIDTTQTISTPVREGYTFNGWVSDTGINVYDDSGVTKWSGDADTTLTAEWTPITYTVKYLPNGATGGTMADSTFTYDDATAKLRKNTYVREYPITYNIDSTYSNANASDYNYTFAYRFNDWFDNDNSSKRYTDEQNVGSNGGLLAEPGTIKLNPSWTYSNLKLPDIASLTKSGYTFDGWYKDSGFTTPAQVSDRPVSAGITLYAKFSPNSYTITYRNGDATGGTVPESFNVQIGDNVALDENTLTKSDSAGFTLEYLMGSATGGTLPAIYTQSVSYSENGWSTSPGGEHVYDSGEMFEEWDIASDLNLYPAWTKTCDSVTISANNLSKANAVTGNVTFKYKNGLTSDSVANINTHYTPNGWSNEDGGTKIYDGGETLTLEENIELYPLFSSANDTVTFERPTRTGYTFREWNTSEDGTGEALNSYNLSNELTVYAIWDPWEITNELRYDLNGADSPSSISSQIMNTYYPNTQSSFTLSSVVPVKAGYTFAGWTKHINSGDLLTSPYLVNIPSSVESVTDTVFASWTKNKYTVSFKNKEKTEDLFTSIQVEFNEPIGDIYTGRIPTKDGYLFGGWYLDSDTSYSTRIDSSYLVTSNITLVPRWFEVKFDATDKEYDGNIKEPVITVSDDSSSPVSLTKGTDYTVTDDGDKINYGSRTITVSGDNSKGIYGSVSKTFNIQRKPINYSDVVILNYNNTDNTIDKEFDLTDKTNVKILANDIILAYRDNSNIRFNFNLNNSYYDSASPSNTAHKDITLSNITIDTSTTNNHYYSGPSSLTFTGYGMIKDTTSPVITNAQIISLANIYGLGQVITFKVTTNEDVTLSGGAQVKLNVSDPSGTLMGGADYSASDSSQNELVFKYTVKNADNGITGKLKVNLNLQSGTIKDSFGNDLTLTITDAVNNNKNIEINTEGFVIPANITPNIQASETTTVNEISVTYDLSSLTLKGCTIDTLISAITVSKDINGTNTVITSNPEVTITKNDTNKTVTVKVDTTAFIDPSNRDGVKVIFDVPKEVLTNELDNKNIASSNEIKVLRNLDDAEIVIKYDGKILNHDGTIYIAYENDTFEAFIKDNKSGNITYTEMPNSVITKTLYKFTNFVLARTGWANSLPFDIEFKIRTINDIIRDINNIITDPDNTPDDKINKIKDILTNPKDLNLIDLDDDGDGDDDGDKDYIKNNVSDIAKKISELTPPINDVDDLVQKLKEVAKKDKEEKTVKPSSKKKKKKEEEKEEKAPEVKDEDKFTHYSYIKGYEDRTFRPNAFITRAEVASLLSQLSTDYDSNVNYKENIYLFVDMDEDAWYSNYFGYAIKENIMNGYKNSTLKPNESITRAEFAKVICKLFDLEVSDENVKHIWKDAENKWYEKYANTLWEYGYAEGYLNNTFRGNNSITRAEAVKIINNALKRDDLDKSMLTEEQIQKFENTFVDVDDKWYYIEIFEAVMDY